jgi:hypothetical protein
MYMQLEEQRRLRKFDRRESSTFTYMLVFSVIALIVIAVPLNLVRLK